MSSCSCVYVDDYDSPSFCKQEIRTARKNHKCYECGKDINPKEKYENTSGCWDGRFDTYKTCMDCLSVRNSFFCDGYYFGSLWEMLADHIGYVGEVSSDCIVSLTPRAREKVCEMIEECWEDFDD